MGQTNKEMMWVQDTLLVITLGPWEPRGGAPIPFLSQFLFNQRALKAYPQVFQLPIAVCNKPSTALSLKQGCISIS